jgi:hypothetical protein
MFHQRPQLLAQQIARTKEMRLDRTLRQLEAARSRGNVLLVKIIQREDLAVLRRKALDGLVNRRALVALFESAVDGMGIARLMDLVERQLDWRDAAKLGAV